MKVERKYTSKHFFRYLGVLICLLSTQPIWSQKLDVVGEPDYNYSPNYANTKDYQVRDRVNQDQWTALVIVDTDLMGLQMNAGTLSIIERKEKPENNQVWFYVQAGAKSVQFMCAGYTSTYQKIKQLKQATTCFIKLTHDQIKTQSSIDLTRSQILDLTVIPKTARVVIGSSYADMKDGHHRKSYPVGEHDYHIIDPQNFYHEASGKIILNGNDSVKNVVIQLKQAYGWIQLDTRDLSGISLVQDDSIKIKDLTTDKMIIPSGPHHIKLQKDLNTDYDVDVQIQDSVVTTITPKFFDSCAKITVTTDKDSYIYIDNEQKAKGKWTGQLGAGEHRLKAERGSSYRPIEKLITVVNHQDAQYMLDAPQPIYSALTVTTNPSGAEVFVDGVQVGVTPLRNFSNILIGKHEVKIVKEGYRIEQKDYMFTENDTCVVNKTLTDVVNLKIVARPSGAYISVKDHNMSYTPYTESIPSGDYDVSVFKNNYYELQKNIHVDGTHTEFDFKLKRIYFRKSGAYIEGFVQGGNLTAYGGALGIYIKNVNIEGYYMSGTSESETVWWNGSNSENGVKYPDAYTYKTTSIGGKIGYGILLTNWLRVTPQIGGRVTKLAGTPVYADDFLNDSYSSVRGAESTYVASATFGIRFHVPVTSWLGFSVTPELSTKVSAGKAYEKMSEISSTLKAWGNGINCRVGLNIFF